MLSLSLTARSNRNRYTCTAICALDTFEAAGFAAGADMDAAAYKRYLFARLRQPHSQTVKDAQRILALHRRGLTVVLRFHQDADHADIALAALRWFDAGAPAAAPAASRRSDPALTHTAAAVEVEAFEADDLDPRRFVWILAKDGACARLGYVWDTDGVITALVPGFGLVKLGRILRQRMRRRHGRWEAVRTSLPFWLALAAGPDLTKRFHAARVELGGRIERVFASLVRRQRLAETIINEQRSRPDPDRYDPWGLEFDPFDAALAADDAQEASDKVEADTRAFLALHAPSQPVQWADLLPSNYRGEHVQPVVKTKPDGSRWILTPEMQGRGSLTAFRRVA